MAEFGRSAKRKYEKAMRAAAGNVAKTGGVGLAEAKTTTDPTALGRAGVTASIGKHRAQRELTRNQ
jgi:hypothetical protein